MREIIIKNRKETNVTDEALYELFNESFKRWTEKGLEAPWLNVSFEKFCKQLNSSTVFIAVDATTDELLGLHCFRGNRRHRRAFDFYLAVAPKAQGQGISSRMLAYEAEVFKKAKNGYRIVGYYRVPNNNFTNYVFRKQLAPSILWGPTLGPLTARMSFAASWLVNHVLKHSDGRDNLLGRFARRMIHQGH